MVRGIVCEMAGKDILVEVDNKWHQICHNI